MKRKAKADALKELMNMVVGMGMLEKMPETPGEKIAQKVQEMDREDDEDELGVVDAVPTAAKEKKPKGVQLSLTRLSAMQPKKPKEQMIASAPRKRGRKRGSY